MAALTTAAGFQVANQSVHADTNSVAPQTQHQQTPQEQYDQAAHNANQQIANQSAANAAKEADLAKQNEAVTSQAAKTTSDENAQYANAVTK